MKPQSPPDPSTAATRRARNKAAAKSTHSGASRHVVGDAASASPGTGSDTEPSSDWLEERVVSPAPAAEDGVPVSTESPRGLRRGKAIESKRGQQ